MPNEPGAALIAEIGSTTTRVTLIDVVEGEFRLIGQAEVLSSVELPQQDALAAVLEATAQIAEATGRTLLRDSGQLVMPQDKERDGIDRFVAITSAAGLLALVITAIASDVSARSALRASGCTYTSVLQVVTLDDAARQEQGDSERSWIERQVQTLLGLQPDAVLIAGGLEGGAEDAINRLAHIVALTGLQPGSDTATNGQPRPNVLRRPVLYAGNSGARERVLEALSGTTQTLIVDNLRPSLDHEQLEPTRRELTKLYAEQMLTRLPGLPSLRRISAISPTTVCAAQGLMTRYLAARFGRNVLALDVGSASSAAYLAGDARYSPAVLGNCGVGYGLSSVLSQRGVAAIARWLPFAIDETQLTHRLLNKLLRPHMHPASREDALIEQAVAREVLTLVLERLRDERPDMRYDLVILGGSTLAHAPHPGLALLTLLDALQPLGGETHPANGASVVEPGDTLDLHLDSLGLLAAAGAMAPLDADAAMTLCERDLLRSTPLATCVVALGSGRSGEVAMEAELVTLRGQTRRVSVLHGQLARLPLTQGTTGQLTLRPAPGVRIGRNAPGVEVSTDVAAIRGSALGVVIDARGRPLELPDAAEQRRTALWEWMVALGVERGPSPYQDQNSGAALLGVPALPTSTVAAKPEVVAPNEPAAPKGKRISLDELAAQETARSEPAAAAPPRLESDLAQLRGTVETPQKKGWFGRNAKR